MRYLAVGILMFASTAVADAPKAPTPTPAPACNAVQLDKDAQNAFGTGNYGVALNAAEQAARCEPTERRYMQVVLTACKRWRGRRSEPALQAKLKQYMPKLSAQKRDRLAEICFVCVYPYD